MSNEPKVVPSAESIVSHFDVVHRPEHPMDPLLSPSSSNQLKLGLLGSSALSPFVGCVTPSRTQMMVGGLKALPVIMTEPHLPCDPVTGDFITAGITAEPMCQVTSHDLAMKHLLGDAFACGVDAQEETDGCGECVLSTKSLVVSGGQPERNCSNPACEAGAAFRRKHNLTSEVLSRKHLIDVKPTDTSFADLPVSSMREDMSQKHDVFAVTEEGVIIDEIIRKKFTLKVYDPKSKLYPPFPDLTEGTKLVPCEQVNHVNVSIE